MKTKGWILTVICSMLLLVAGITLHQWCLSGNRLWQTNHCGGGS